MRAIQQNRPSASSTAAPGSTSPAEELPQYLPGCIFVLILLLIRPFFFNFFNGDDFYI